MANNATVVTGNNVYGLRAYSQRVVSTLLNSCVVLAAFGLMNSNKGDAIYNVGTPEAGMMLSGADVPPATKREIVECEAYYPEIENVDQRDVKNMGYRDTSATMSTSANGDPTFTVTVSSGVITAVSVDTNNTGWSGCPPTIVAVDAGYTGQGAVLTGVVTSGTLTVEVTSGGYGYSASVSGLAFYSKSAGEKSIRPCFRWTHKETEGYVYKRDIDRFRALQQSNVDLFNAKVNDLTSREQLRMVSALLQYVNNDMMFGTPTTPASNDPWDHQYGLDAALDVDNVYGGLDRSVTANYFWRARQDTTTHVFTLEQLWADSHLTKGIGYLNGNIDVYIVSPTLMEKYNRESSSYQIIAQSDPGVQKLRAFGFKSPVIKYNTSYVISDIRVAPKTIYGLNMASWIFATKSGYNFKFQGWEDQTLKEGGKQAFYGLCDIQYMLACNAPALNVCYTAVS
jgi:hypothetical protein